MKAFVCSVLMLPCLCQAVQAETKREPLFDVTLDMDADGKSDRAVLVLVGPGRDRTWDLSRGTYPLSEEETVDLAIFLGAGNAPLDLSKAPTILKQSIIDLERTRWVQSLEVVHTSSLKVGSNYQPGASHDFEENLTIAYRKGQFFVVGYDTFWENPNGIGNCQINLSTGRGIRAEGEFPGPIPNFVAKVSPVPLANWGEKTRPTDCDLAE